MEFDAESLKLACNLLGSSSYLEQGMQANQRRQKLVRVLLASRNLPEEGWENDMIENFVQYCSTLDTNNFVGNCGAGEREARVASELVRRRHFGLGHGIGRSGDVAAVQPKAAGSSLIYKITTSLVLDLFKNVLGMHNIKGILVLPLATGMSLSLVLQCLRHKEQEQKPNAKYVIWTRIDQKTCLKAVHTAGYQPLVIENNLTDDIVSTNLEEIKRTIQKVGKENIVAVLSTTSCFAPRIPDDVEGIAKICKENQIAHVINNAYGLQCKKCCHIINSACRVGRVDAIVQSSDKNLMVPVGGAIIAGPNKKFIEQTVSQTYPGRASISPILDIFLTLMSWGKNGYKKLRQDRIDVIPYFRNSLEQIASKYGERVLETSKRNTISFAMTLTSLLGVESESNQGSKVERDSKREDSQVDSKTKSTSIYNNATKFGSMLFTRGVSGARVVAPGMSKTVAEIHFENYGASTSVYPCAYVTLACAIGITSDEIDLLMRRLELTCKDFQKLIQSLSSSSPASATGAESDAIPKLN